MKMNIAVSSTGIFSKLLISAFLFICCDLAAQEIAGCVEILGIDSIKLYHKDRALSEKACAQFYRHVKLGQDGFYFNGPSRDYYFSSGRLAVDCSYANGVLEGEYKSFYYNGKIKETGRFDNGLKTGEWKYWYENGLPRKTILFTEGKYFLKEFYDADGKQLVADGQGKYAETGVLPSTTMRGEIQNGRQHGRWVIFDERLGFTTSEEFFMDGRFVEGHSMSAASGYSEKYTDEAFSMVDLTYDLLPGSNTRRRDCIWPGASYQPKSYGKAFDSRAFFDFIYQNFDPPKFESGYILAGFTVSQYGAMSNIAVHSTLPDEVVSRQLVSVLNSGGRWKPMTLNEKQTSSTELLIFRFHNGMYQLDNDYRNGKPPVDYSAQYTGSQGLTDLFGNIDVPDKFRTTQFNLSALLHFHIDEQGNCTVYESDVKTSKNEDILCESAKQILKKTSGSWQAATYQGSPVVQHFIGIVSIRDGKPSFRMLSNNWVMR